MRVSPPEYIDIDDHDVFIKGDYLNGKRIAVLISGSIGAMTIPLFVRRLRSYRADVHVYASTEALRYVTEEALEWSSDNKVVTDLTCRSEHLGINGKPFDAYIFYPATYNTINKMANGIADSCLTTTFASALGYHRFNHSGFNPTIFVGPIMHGSMHNQILQDSLDKLKRNGVNIIDPDQRNFKDNMPNDQKVAVQIIRGLSKSSLGYKSVIVTAGPTPTKIDSVRRITNKFSGKLGILIAEELYLRGENVHLFQAESGIRPPKYIPHTLFNDYDEYKYLVVDNCHYYDWGVFSAAVADYAPVHPQYGKIKSGTLKKIKLKPTEKVIDLVREENPHLKMVSFKYEHDVTQAALADIANDRLGKGHKLVVGNIGTEIAAHGTHVGYIFQQGKVQKCKSKEEIAKTLVEEMNRYPQRY